MLPTEILVKNLNINILVIIGIAVVTIMNYIIIIILFVFLCTTGWRGMTIKELISELEILPLMPPCPLPSYKMVPA